MHSFAMNVDSYSLFTMTQYKLLYESLFIQIIKRSIIPESLGLPFELTQAGLQQKFKDILGNTMRAFIKVQNGLRI